MAQQGSQDAKLNNDKIPLLCPAIRAASVDHPRVDGNRVSNRDMGREHGGLIGSDSLLPSHIRVHAMAARYERRAGIV